MRSLLPASLAAGQRLLVEELVAALAQIPGVTAVVLGGSHARGAARASSDIDLGLYYRPSAAFAIDDIAAVARAVALQPPTVTGFYEWGAWVNGGAWIQTAAGKVDFLYRSLDQVERTIEEAEQGIVHHDYPQQPPYGFYSLTYLAETDICLPLFDPSGVLARLKRRVRVYPATLQQHVTNRALWSAEFTLLHAQTFASQGDIYNTAGCLTRVATDLTQALFALNRCYFMSDKGALQAIENFSHRPANYGATLNNLLAAPGADAQALQRTVQALHDLWQQVVELTDGAYRPAFVV